MTRQRIGTLDAGALQRLVDRADIHDLLCRYARACDTKDWSLYRSLFTPDAVIDYTAAFGIQGSLSDVSDWMARVVVPSSVPKTQHLITNMEIARKGRDHASAHAYFINPNIQRDASGNESLLLHGGYYTATVRRTEQGWRIARLVDEVTFSHRGALEQFQLPNLEQK